MDEGQIVDLAKGYELMETHISWVLLSDDFAYKIKKPVRFSFLDFSTLGKRRYFCEEEVRLNRRLSPDMYIGVVPITEIGRKPSFGGDGEPIGYAVKMKRLSQDRRMDLLFAYDKVTPAHIERIAKMIADFHEGVDVIDDKAYGSADSVKRQIDDLGGFRATIEDACGLGEETDLILERSDMFIESNKKLFEKRQAEGRIRDCHGDLHSQNIFIDDDIVIFDCIEFSRDFRFIDVASEVAFMAMDLDAFGRHDLSELFIDRYVELSGDAGLRQMLPIYLCYRANVRAKIAAIDHSQRPGDDTEERIRRYIGLAQGYAKML